jgi:2-phospho-L-lactate guanylyltransferase
VDALVPLKRLGEAKSRLRHSLTPTQRVELMRLLLEHAIAQVRDTPQVDRVILVSSEPDAAEIAAGLDVEHFDDRGLAWNDALAAAMGEAVRSAQVLILSADLPLVRSEDVQAFIAAAPQPGVAIARARDAGTNGLVMSPPGAAATCFGATGSAAQHAALATAAGLASAIVDIPGLALDLDVDDDVRAALAGDLSADLRALLSGD